MTEISTSIFTDEALGRMAKLPAGSIDIVCTDLPYGETAQSWDVLIPIAPMWKQIKRLCTKDAAILLFAQNTYGARLICSQEKAFKFKYYWKKNRAPNCHQAQIQPLRNCEEILVFCFGKLPYFPQKSTGHQPTKATIRRAGTTEVYRQAETFSYAGGDTERFPKTILEFDCLDNDAPERVHSNQKPVDMLQHLIRQHTRPGQTVLDFCAGSGSLGVAARMEKRSAVLIEMQECYTDHARRWINKLNGRAANIPISFGKAGMPLFGAL